MNEETTEHERNLRDLYAGFAMIALIMKGEPDHNVSLKAKLFAEDMINARNEQPTGIVAAKTKPKKEKS